MRVVVTGASGFIGRALVDRLRTLGHDVVATDREGVGMMVGDLRDPALLERIFAKPVNAVVHLATIPGGAAEVDPALAWDVNVEASRALVDTAARYRPRVVFASSIAVFGDPLPAHADDAMPVMPQMLYGAHKVIMEEWIACQSRRGSMNGISLRLPGVVARPPATSGMISAFISDVFHAFRGGKAIDLPVSAQATLWLLSRSAAVEALVHAVLLAEPRVGERVTLPALRITMGDLIGALAAATGRDAGLARFRPNERIEAVFGALPPLATARGDTLGFRHDGSTKALVAHVLADLDEEQGR